MSKMSCLIVEDQLPAQRVLQTYIGQFDRLELAATCSSATEALEVLETQNIDLMFLDIHLPNLDGFSFLRSLVSPPEVIVTTAYSEYAVEGFELNVLDYLLKPVSMERFSKAIAKAGKADDKPQVAAQGRSLFVKVDGDFVRINTNQIVHIASDGNFLRINMEEENHYILGTLHTWLEKLPKEDFVRVQRSHVVNLNHIEKISGNMVLTHIGAIPIGRTYKRDLITKVAEKQVSRDGNFVPKAY